jgi:hypothetical protein
MYLPISLDIEAAHPQEIGPVCGYLHGHTPPPGKDFFRFCRKSSEKLDNCRGMGEKMTYAEFENLLLLADRMIASCVPRKAEYGRGYQGGIKFHFYNPQPGSPPDHYAIAEIARKNGSREVHAYARGYRDGCKGLMPDDTG